MKRSPLRKISKKRSIELKEYAKVRKKILSEHPTCQRCQGRNSTDIHHKHNRGTGGALNSVDNLVALCRLCHTWIHANPSQARREGWLK